MATTRQYGLEQMRGYLYVPAVGAAMLVYARNLTSVALTIALTSDDPDHPERGRAVHKAVVGKPAGLYRARVVLDRLAPPVPRAPSKRARFRVTCGRRVSSGPATEIAALTARVKALKAPGKARAAAKRLRTVREARALVDALRVHVLHLTATPPIPEVYP